jgi:hypothetical protein
MGGGLMQLVAYGAQDIYLTGNPQITFFKVVYRRHTNFSMEEIAQTPNGSVAFDSTASFTISRNGDLVHKMYFEFSPKDLLVAAAFLAGDDTKQLIGGTYMGNTILKEIECEIGGQKIDRHYGHWLSTWADLTEPNPCGEIGQIGVKATANGNNCVLFEPGGRSGTATAIATGHGGRSTKAQPSNAAGVTAGEEVDGGRPTKFQKMSFNHLGIGANNSNTNTSVFTNTANPAVILATGTTTSTNLPKKAFVPLRFWFNRNPGLALPLIALQYHEVKINIKFCSEPDLFVQVSNGAALTTAFGTSPKLTGKLYAQYIYLDTDERRRFAQVSHEYLIEQLQFQNESGTNGTYTLNFNHPVKEIVWGGTPIPTGFMSVTGADDTNLCPVSGPTVLGPFHGTIAGGGEAGDISCLHTSQVVGRGTKDSSHNGCMEYTASGFNTQGGNAKNAMTWQLKLNGHDRFAARPITYFSRQQIFDHHTGYGCVPSKDSILVYSFALKPEEHQPSGTCNFSRIDTAQLVSDAGDAIERGIYIYAVNYNVLRIMSGMGGLAYSN